MSASSASFSSSSTANADGTADGTGPSRYTDKHEKDDLFAIVSGANGRIGLEIVRQLYDFFCQHAAALENTP